MITELNRMSESEREALCTRCGTACHFALEIEVDGEDVAVVIDELRCRFLERDESGRAHCSVYDERFERAPWCADLDEALATGELGRGCPYPKAAGIADYRGKIWLTDEGRAALLPTIRAGLMAEGAPLGASEAGLRRLLDPDGRLNLRFEQHEEQGVVLAVPTA